MNSSVRLSGRRSRFVNLLRCTSNTSRRSNMWWLIVVFAFVIVLIGIGLADKGHG
jgi:hypothetical protein